MAIPCVARQVLCGGMLWLLAATVLPAAELADRVRPLIESHAGQAAVAIENLQTGVGFAHNADRPMPTASLIKLPLMVAAYQAIADGKVSTQAMITLRAEDQVPGSGILTPHFSPGMQLSLRDAIRLMIAYSDNSATNLVIDQVGLPATTELMAKLGLPETRLNSQVYRRETSIAPERSREFGLGSTTAAEMVALLSRLHRRELVDADRCDEMLAHLQACDDRLKFRRYLPKAKIAHKTGSVNAVRCDAGLIDSPAGTIVICVLTSDNKDQSWGEENAGDLLCARIAREAYQFFNPGVDAAEAVDPAPLKLGASGPLVESLQRTLNARATPAPELSVDGDFGPVTQGAVIAFQRSRGLEANGVVGPETWAALGPIIEPNEEAAGSASEEPAPRAPADRLDGPPIVSCRAWAVADAATGEILWGSQAEQPLDNASTTKMMTAFLVLEYAAQHPEVLEEVVEFSRRADATVGSTAGIRTGERIVVRDLMYGLMLPSGNDASVALAEHFGGRIGLDGAEVDAAAAYDGFIAAMNRRAGELGMSATHYDNPHGLTTKTHKSSAGDLVRLAYAGWQLPLFREIVNTPRYACVVTGPGGYQRPVAWKNTNQLLGIEGFSGVKTGTTTAAGACLVSRGERDGRGLLVAVLGSASSESRYVDSRNLYRWAWMQASVRTPEGR